MPVFGWTFSTDVRAVAAPRSSRTLTRGDEHRTVNGIEKKHCPMCKTWKALSEYNKC